MQRLLSGDYTDEKQASLGISKLLKGLNVEKCFSEIESAAAFLITPEDSDWPTQLNDLAAPPIALIGRGIRELLLDSFDSIAIVGTRNPTSYGVKIAGDFAASICDREWGVVSGGAYGIDSAAHEGALAAEGMTIAVLGGGISDGYPRGNERLFAKIADFGLIISEVLPHVPALPHRFLIRNRVIAALSRGTIVVEAAYRSGSLRTARDAQEIYRPVMAIPGPINSPTSEGTHRLILERKAELVSSVNEVMELVLPLI